MDWARSGSTREREREKRARAREKEKEIARVCVRERVCEREIPEQRSWSRIISGSNLLASFFELGFIQRTKWGCAALMRIIKSVSCRLNFEVTLSKIRVEPAPLPEGVRAPGRLFAPLLVPSAIRCMCPCRHTHHYINFVYYMCTSTPHTHALARAHTQKHTP